MSRNDNSHDKITCFTHSKVFRQSRLEINMRHCGFDTANNIVKVLSNFIMCSGFDDRFINLKIIQIYNTTFSVLMAVLSVKCIVITPTISFSVPEIYHWSYVGGLWFGNYYDFVFTMLLYVSPTPFVFITKIWNSLSLKSPTVVKSSKFFSTINSPYWVSNIIYCLEMLRLETTNSNIDLLAWNSDVSK